MGKKALIEEVKKILDGIDREETDLDFGGWWETSVGADFGYNKLEDVIVAIEDAEPSVPVSELEELLIWLTTPKQVSTIGVAQHIEALITKAKGE